ncbi:type VI secretion system contractile sheath small subunit [Hahella sp. SMD15-11]|uniref:Type VI secretion system contractile sheath small subunit n=1 Tax=Thermohahella caldifontis TaxID=3142973 RepID=A0AB39UZK7_9GAMM
MAKDGSVAPRERINIQYKSETGAAEESIELPFKMLVTGDFTNREDDRMVEERKPINVDKDNFDDVLASQNIEINMTVANRLSDEEDEEMGVTLNVRSIRDFTPDAIVGQVPELRALMDLREALVALKGPLGNVPAFRKMIEETLKDDNLKAELFRELGIEG